MKTFEEIFDSIIEEREEKKEKKREEENNLNNLRLAEEFLKEEKVIDTIFKNFRFQVINGAEYLSCRVSGSYDLYGDQILLIKDILYAKLKEQLPSYDIRICCGTSMYACYRYFYLNIKAKKFEG